MGERFDQITGQAAQFALNLIEAHEQRQAAKAARQAMLEEVVTNVKLIEKSIKEPEQPRELVLASSQRSLVLSQGFLKIAGFARTCFRVLKTLGHFLDEATQPPPTSSAYQTLDDVLRQRELQFGNPAPKLAAPIEEQVVAVKANFARQNMDISDVEILDPTTVAGSDQPGVQVATPSNESFPDNDKDAQTMRLDNDITKDLLGDRNAVRTAKAKRRRKKKKTSQEPITNSKPASQVTEEAPETNLKEHDMEKRRILPAKQQTPADNPSGLDFGQTTIPQNLPKFKDIDAPVESNAKRRRVLGSTIESSQESESTASVDQANPELRASNLDQAETVGNLASELINSMTETDAKVSAPVKEIDTNVDKGVSNQESVSRVPQPELAAEQELLVEEIPLRDTQPASDTSSDLDDDLDGFLEAAVEEFVTTPAEQPDSQTQNGIENAEPLTPQEAVPATHETVDSQGQEVADQDSSNQEFAANEDPGVIAQESDSKDKTSDSEPLKQGPAMEEATKKETKTQSPFATKPGNTTASKASIFVTKPGTHAAAASGAKSATGLFAVKKGVKAP